MARLYPNEPTWGVGLQPDPAGTPALVALTISGGETHMLTFDAAHELAKALTYMVGRGEGDGILADSMYYGVEGRPGVYRERLGEERASEAQD